MTRVSSIVHVKDEKERYQVSYTSKEHIAFRIGDAGVELALLFWSEEAALEFCQQVYKLEEEIEIQRGKRQIAELVQPSPLEAYSQVGPDRENEDGDDDIPF